MSENDTPLDELKPVRPKRKRTAADRAQDAVEDTLASIDQTLDAGQQATKDALAEANDAIDTLAGGASEPVVVPPPVTVRVEGQPAAPKSEVPKVEAPRVEAPKSEPAPQRAHAKGDGPKPTLTEHLTEDQEYDANASNDDRLMAALAYGSQILIPLLFPAIILLSEASKKRPFQRFHAIQALALGIVISALELVLAVLSGIAASTFILLLCLCLIIPAMIVLWLLPLYYAILAYNGKRFRIPGLTQFLEDQKWV